MMRKLAVTLALVAISASLWLARSTVQSESLNKLFYTSVAIASVYAFFKLMIEAAVVRGVSEPRTQYGLRKAVSVLAWIVSIILTVRVWIPNPQALLVGYGLVGAGVAVALQDVFKNFAGGILILSQSPFRVGDRIEIDGRYGDVIDISLMFSLLMETRQWVEGDQATGRITIVPNGLVLSKVVNNYTRDFGFIWDELSIPVTYDSDWKKAQSLMASVAQSLTSAIIKKAENQLSSMEGKYFVSKRNVQPTVLLSMTDNWINLRLRYVTEARGRRDMNSRMSQAILERFQKEKRIRVASSTFGLAQVPPIEVRVKSK